MLYTEEDAKKAIEAGHTLKHHDGSLLYALGHDFNDITENNIDKDCERKFEPHPFWWEEYKISQYYHQKLIMTEQIEQRTPEWFKVRKGRVTGSNVGAILGLSPFMKPKDVMRRMVRDWHNAPSEFTGNAATEYGTFHERIAKMDFEMEHNIPIQEVGFYTYEYWLGASPDGILDNYTLIEIKCPYGQREKNPPVFKTLTEQPHYYAQIQIQLFTTNMVYCNFYQWSPFGQQMEMVVINHQWINENLPKLKVFYNEYLIERELPSAQKYFDDKRQQVRCEGQVNRYLLILDQIKELETEKKRLLDEIVKLANGIDSEINGHKLTKVIRAGSVSYAKAIKDLCPDADLTKYTGKPTEFWKLS